MHTYSVVYVTRSGHSRELANEAGRRLGAQVFEIVDLVPRRGFFGYMRSGFQATRKKATPIRDPFVHLERVDSLVVVQPVWASAVCPPLRSWLAAHRSELGNLRLALILSNKGSDPSRVRSAFESEFMPLAAMACIPEKTTGEDRTSLLDAFTAELNAGA